MHSGSSLSCHPEHLFVSPPIVLHILHRRSLAHSCALPRCFHAGFDHGLSGNSTFEERRAAAFDGAAARHTQCQRSADLSVTVARRRAPAVV